MQSKASIRVPRPCGLDFIQEGRRSAQMGWYTWVGENLTRGETVLDVGAGLCHGLRILSAYSWGNVWGIDVDSQLEGAHPHLEIVSISTIPSQSYDVVACLDVIEHVVDDLDFLNHLLRVARKRVIVTTPNWDISRAENPHHCREYRESELRALGPRELWGGSSDGFGEKVLLPDSRSWDHFAAVFSVGLPVIGS